MSQYEFGLIGLGVMGRNFILNVAEHGHATIGLDKDKDKVTALKSEATTPNITATTDIHEFVHNLSTPRKIMMLVPAGRIVDEVIGEITPLLDPGDLIIDGGNSHFEDTNDRELLLSARGILFMGVGISGGAKGARTGPSIMPGGTSKTYEMMATIFRDVAARVNGQPCVTHVGTGSAGNFVKMAHNGIEYGLMQLIAEVYDLMEKGALLDKKVIQSNFTQWNKGKLKSYLIEITGEILKKKDSQSKGWLVDKILDKAKQKGTGKWTSQNAMDLGIPIPTIDSAITMRAISSNKVQRKQAYDVFQKSESSTKKLTMTAKELEEGLFAAFLITYAQGFTLITAASKEYGYQIYLPEIARIWQGGCIIRADLLHKIEAGFLNNPQLVNILLEKDFYEDIIQSVRSLRKIVMAGIMKGIPVMALTASLSYFDALKSGALPLNLVQAQRDYFGSHTYERVDGPGIFHTDWEDD